jgi:hypothetical protein
MSSADYLTWARTHFNHIRDAVADPREGVTFLQGFDNLPPDLQAVWAAATGRLLRVAATLVTDSEQDEEYNNRQWQRRFGLVLATIEAHGDPELIRVARRVANAVPSATGAPEGVTPVDEALALTQVSIGLAVEAGLVETGLTASKEARLLMLVRQMRDGMREWARDTGGIHYRAWEAYANAFEALGEPNPEPQDDDK